MYLSTLRSYVEAVGGKLELVVKLPRRPALHLQHLGEATGDPGPVESKPRARGRAAAS